jgi:hypothetical protein
MCITEMWLNETFKIATCILTSIQIFERTGIFRTQIYHVLAELLSGCIIQLPVSNVDVIFN